METFPTGTETPFARAIAAEVRARAAAQRLTIRDLASGAGFKSHNYLAIRLRDEKPMTVDDLARICDFFDVEVVDFVRAAYDNHDERIWTELSQIAKSNRAHPVSEGAPTLRAVARKKPKDPR